MRNVISILFILTLAAFTCQTALAEADNSDSMPQNLMEQFVEAWNSNNVQAVSSMFAENAVYIGKGHITRGHEAIQEWLHGAMEITHSLEIDPELSGSSGDVAYQIGSFSTAYWEGTVSGSYAVIFERNSDGKWKIVALEEEEVGDPEGDRH
ncbi:MAG: nuclear transport factor 2 family protein [Gammaproteobacteria bacterium]|nr:nuclear transport factor 2 family protein [Gammaproteobacteria bacterium]